MSLPARKLAAALLPAATALAACSPSPAPAGPSPAPPLTVTKIGVPFHTESGNGQGPVEILVNRAETTTCAANGETTDPAPGNVHVLLQGEIATGRTDPHAEIITAPDVASLTEDRYPTGHALPDCDTTTGTVPWEEFHAPHGAHAHLETTYEVNAAASALRVGDHQIEITEGTK